MFDPFQTQDLFVSVVSVRFVANKNSLHRSPAGVSALSVLPQTDSDMLLTRPPFPLYINRLKISMIFGKIIRKTAEILIIFVEIIKKISANFISISQQFIISSQYAYFLYGISKKTHIFFRNVIKNHGNQ